MKKKTAESEAFFRRTGITFNVYGQEQAAERLIPFDVIPRIISEREWSRLSRGIEQRVRAINAFLHDLYHRQEIIRAGRIPAELIAQNDAFLPQMIGVSPPGNVYTHIVGTDIVRTGEDEFFVLEDNARTPSGVSYMLENRETMLHMFPELFAKVKVQPVSDYPTNLRRSLGACAPSACVRSRPLVAVLTPGIHNSAYFEHAFLADQMGAELVEGHDLRVVDGRVAMRTTLGYEPIDVLYRRVDDEFLDPLNFNPNSLLGVPGIMDVYRAGGITIANAPGTGIADDKAIYSYIPEIVEFYTGEKAILKNVPTWRCAEPEALAYVLDHLTELVVKEVHGSGGYGMLVGPAASKKELAAFTSKLKAKPGNYIAQPTLSLSTVPILTKKGLSPRHVDLRPFVLVSPNKINITPGGLTRVALKEGSLVVNSSQGGGTKDTWVLEE
ncbi:MAG TPA: circularly permuted type 2 ATP-grasp protein [Magnetovibrio sp.]